MCLLAVTVAAGLIAKGSIEVSGYQLHVTKPPVTSPSCTDSPPGNSVYVENVRSGWMKSLQRYNEVTFSDPQGLHFV